MFFSRYKLYCLTNSWGEVELVTFSTVSEFKEPDWESNSSLTVFHSEEGTKKGKSRKRQNKEVRIQKEEKEKRKIEEKGRKTERMNE